MSPPIELFHVSQLEERIQHDVNGKIRKPPTDLKKCELQELVQYKCEVKGDRRNSPTTVVCKPLVRYFRRYVVNFPLVISYSGLVDERS